MNKRREVPFGTLFSLAELIGGVALAGYWFGLYAAIAVWPAGALVAFILTLAIVGHVQAIWVAAQLACCFGASGCCFPLSAGPSLSSDPKKTPRSLAGECRGVPDAGEVPQDEARHKVKRFELTVLAA